MISMSVQGLTQAIEKFAAIQARAEASARPMAGAVAEPVLATARALVPVDTGRLHDSLQTRPDPQDPTAVLVGTEVEYARFPEFGTVNMAAQPYLRPAAEAGGSQAARLAGVVLGRVLSGFGGLGKIGRLLP